MKNFKVLLLAFLSVILTAGNVMAEQSELESEPFSDGELEQILAPIALYPDTVLSHILVAATYPLEVIQAERWTSKNPDLTGSSAVKLLKNKNGIRALKHWSHFHKCCKNSVRISIGPKSWVMLSYRMKNDCWLVCNPFDKKLTGLEI